MPETATTVQILMQIVYAFVAFLTVLSRRFLPRDHLCYRAVLGVVILSVRPSTCPSVTRVLCDKTKRYTADILIPYETAITLFWHHQWLVDDAPLHLKSEGSKLSTPFEKRLFPQIFAYNVSTVRDSQKVQLRWIGSRPWAFQRAIQMECVRYP